MKYPQSVARTIRPIYGLEKDLENAGDRLGKGLLHQ
jgi:hypothetical protein